MLLDLRYDLQQVKCLIYIPVCNLLTYHFSR